MAQDIREYAPRLMQGIIIRDSYYPNVNALVEHPNHEGVVYQPELVVKGLRKGGRDRFEESLDYDKFMEMLKAQKRPLTSSQLGELFKDQFNALSCRVFVRRHGHAAPVTTPDDRSYPRDFKPDEVKDLLEQLHLGFLIPRITEDLFELKTLRGKEIPVITYLFLWPKDEQRFLVQDGFSG